jgi:hypothetical protein
MPGISTAEVSAPAFIAAATGRKVYHPFQLAGNQVHLTDLVICPTGALVGRSVGAIQADRQVNIVMHQGRGASTSTRATTSSWGPDDVILVIAPMDRLVELEAVNRPGARRKGKTRGATAGPLPLVAEPAASAPEGPAHRVQAMPILPRTLRAVLEGLPLSLPAGVDERSAHGYDSSRARSQPRYGC